MSNLWNLFFSFFKVGLFSFGGGFAMLPLIEAEVEKYGWMTAQELINFVAVSESTPGPLAINLSTYIGILTSGVPGAICATIGVVLPSLVITLLIVQGMNAFRNSRTVQGCMKGLKPAGIGLIAAGMLSVMKTVFIPSGAPVFTDPQLYMSIGIFAVILFLALKKKNPILLIGLSAGIGIACGYLLNL